jgi:hypothetical protein
MELIILPNSNAAPILAESIVGEPSSCEAIADLLRHEVLARGRCPRHFAIGRVCRLAAPAVLLDAKNVDEVCEGLERQGDVLLGDGGYLYAAPVRLVAVDEGVFQFICTIPSSQLISSVPGEWTYQDVKRTCRVAQPLAEPVAALGAIVLTPAVWAGLEHAPSADAEFLQWLDSRLAASPRRAGSLEHDEPLEWMVCQVLASGPSWRRKGKANGIARLWRARHQWRRWIYAWTSGAAPSTQDFIALNADEGARATFALAVAANTPFLASVERSPSNMTITIPGWLPLAEYRYLSTCAEFIGGTGHGSRWVVRVSMFDAVQRTLASRLGLQFDGGRAR